MGPESVQPPRGRTRIGRAPALVEGLLKRNSFGTSLMRDSQGCVSELFPIG